MQKNLLLILCCLWYTGTAFAQQTQFTYQLEVDFQPYEELTEDTLVFDFPWFNAKKKVPLGFEFEYYGRTFDSVTIWNDGLFFDYESTTEDSVYYFMWAFEAFLSDRSIPGPWQTPQSPITYKTDGLPGNRIFKYQMKNGGFSEGGADDYVNFQYWLYEKDMSFEYRYGDIYAPSNAWQDELEGPAIVLVESLSGEIMIIEGEESMPELVSYDQDDTTTLAVGLISHPIEGRIYRLTLADVAVSGPSEHVAIPAFPNPVSNTVTLSVPDKYLGMPYRVTGLDGKVMSTGHLKSKNLNASTWAPGCYVLEIITPTGNASVKLVKK